MRTQIWTQERHGGVLAQILCVLQIIKLYLAFSSSHWLCDLASRFSNSTSCEGKLIIESNKISVLFIYSSRHTIISIIRHCNVLRVAIFSHDAWESVNAQSCIDTIIPDVNSDEPSRQSHNIALILPRFFLFQPFGCSLFFLASFQWNKPRNRSVGINFHSHMNNHVRQNSKIPESLTPILFFRIIDVCQGHYTGGLNKRARRRAIQGTIISGTLGLKFEKVPEINSRVLYTKQRSRVSNWTSYYCGDHSRNLATNSLALDFPILSDIIWFSRALYFPTAPSHLFLP